MKMTNSEALEILQKESGCYKRRMETADECCYLLESCEKDCRFYTSERQEYEAHSIAISAVEQVIEREDDGR